MIQLCYQSLKWLNIFYGYGVTYNIYTFMWRTLSYAHIVFIVSLNDNDYCFA